MSHPALLVEFNDLETDANPVSLFRFPMDLHIIGQAPEPYPEPILSTNPLLPVTGSPGYLPIGKNPIRFPQNSHE
jgi:hypothetical protein